MPMSYLQIVEDIQKRIDAQWEAKPGKMDWPGLETLLRDILGCTVLEAKEKTRFAADAVASYTRRGECDCSIYG